MKKYLCLLLMALMMITVLFVSVSCKEETVPVEEEQTCTVTFETNGGSEIAPVVVRAGTKVSKPKTDPTKEGYVFFGWYKNAACTITYKFTTAVIDDITIYAKWMAESALGKITLNYNYNSKTEVIWSELNKVATIETPTRKGWIFLGWYKDSGYAEVFDTKSTITGNIDLYAKWISQTEYEHSDPILPTGTSATIPTDWSVNPKGMTGLPAIKYHFSGSVTNETNVTAELKAAIATAQATPNFFDETPTKVLFVFSDGWGVTEVAMSREYKGELILDSLPYFTESRTDCYNKYSHDGTNSDYSSKTTTDSPAGGTQVLAGYKTRYGYIALDADANIVPNLSEAAKSKGWYVACVTNDNIVDATPAVSIIHDTNRYHSDVLYYKALMATDWDLLMGWDWGMDTYFNSSDWTAKLLDAAEGGIDDANDREKTGTLSGTPIQFFKKLSTADKAKVAPFLIYYTLWENQDPSRLNSWQRWTRSAAGEAELNAFLAWLDSDSGLKAAINKLDTEYGNPSTHVRRFTDFTSVVNNTDFSKPILGSWKSDGANYEAASPNRGYLLHGTYAEAYPSWPEMVAYTIYQLDRQAGADGGFFAMLENTCTDGWGHSSNNDTKVQGMMNEVQCFDEGVAIAVKYVLEHPDTLLVITADHETGGFELREGWKTDFTKIKSTTTGHSSQNVCLYAFGAGASNFSAEAIAEKFAAWGTKAIPAGGDGSIHEGWITGALIGELITGEAFGEPANYK